MLFQLAWRNVWRNKRRTIITVSSIFFAVLLALFMRSLQKGSYENMIRNAVELYSGYIQIHAKGYWKDKSINKLLEVTDTLRNTIASTPHVNYFISRLETFALAASEDLSKGAVVIGTSPVEEDRMTKLSDKVVSGQYFSDTTDGVLVAEGLANYLKLTLGDTVVMIGQGYHGANAVDQYPIIGIVRFTNPQANNNAIYAPLSLLQQFAGAPGLSSALVISIDDLKEQDQVKAHLLSALGDGYEVMDWQEMQPELVQAIQSDNAGGVILLSILYMIIAFGIFGTVMMMSMERRKEFGVMVAVGMQKNALSRLVMLETCIIGFLGLAISLGMGILLLLYMFHHPIPLTGNAAVAMTNMGIEPLMRFSLDPGIFSSQILAIFVIVCICLLYPLWTISRLKAITAMRH
ncbi:MAG TPA: FtsX-like permease family protein [Chryseosolibacter sp.]|nr:FtsX-like permease family protein [Chryseosolibacter sp.]